ncbi:MAG TPA: serine/threonine-protein kinase [Vicinamibacteria bacterium]|jgi:serine/threonine protein kinase|nr:serine/threonine-protein kinase [Vicinamibacteria bacterium]
MKATRSKDSQKPAASSPRGSAPDRPGQDLLTSQDLFGDMVDAAAPEKGGPSPTHREPIKVKISEPAAPPKGQAGPKGEILPEDVSALITAFSDPEEVGRAPLKKARPEIPDEVKAEVDILLARLDPLEGEEDPTGGAPERGAPVNIDAIFAPAQAPAPAAPTRPVPEDGDDLAPPTSRTAAKFQVAPPQPQLSEDPALDLAALAEDALGRPAPPEPPPERPPFRDAGTWRDDVYGPYRLLDRVAVGGMAEVFKAKRSGVEGFEKIVAVKRILPHLSDNKEFVDMFVNEAKMVAGLTHPNIVQIFDLGRIDKSYYIAMEYVHGRDLRTIMRRAKEKGPRIPLELGLRIVSNVCSALEYAHRKRDDRGRPMQIVHRDVSPQNILISFEGEVKLTDFGIAKAATKASTTDRGALRGKLLYMSPEQAWGKPMDCRSDLFSLGIVLYEIVTDQKPFLAAGGGSEMSILELVRQCHIAPPKSVNPQIADTLDKLLRRALDRDPSRRFQDAAEMGRGLERILHERPPLSANELGRFMELLFDRQEREEALPDDHSSGEHRASLPDPADLGAELEAGPLGAASAEMGGKKDAPEKTSLDALLKKFGIK